MGKSDKIKSMRHVKIDDNLVNKAMTKAKKMNIAKKRAELANFMLARVVDGGFELSMDNFKWEEKGEPSTVSFLNEQYYKLAETLETNGYRSDSYFIFNILIYNFLHNY